MKKFPFTILLSLFSLSQVFLYASSYNNRGVFLTITNKINEKIFGEDIIDSLYWQQHISLRRISTAIIFLISYLCLGLIIDSIWQWLRTKKK